MSPGGKLRVETIRQGLETRVVGREILCFSTTASTNDLVWRSALEGAKEGLVIFADEQKRGRGRFGRSWFAPSGTCLLGSALLRPVLPMEQANLITAIGPLAVVDSIKELCGLDATIRFPNDVLVNEKKISGTLVEARLISSRPDFFIVGVGINGNMSRDDFPEELREEATSLAVETGRRVDLNALARTLIARLDAWVLELADAAGHQRIQEKWKGFSALLGRRVEVKEAGSSFRGKVEDVDVFMGLLVRTDTGYVRHARAEHIESVRLDRSGSP